MQVFNQTGENTAMFARVVTIYRCDDIPRYKHVRLSYHVHLLIHGIRRK